MNRRNIIRSSALADAFAIAPNLPAETPTDKASAERGAVETGSATRGVWSTQPLQLSGIYPSLATFNDEGECGTGAFGAYWLRLIADKDTTATAKFTYE